MGTGNSRLYTTVLLILIFVSPNVVLSKETDSTPFFKKGDTVYNYERQQAVVTKINDDGSIELTYPTDSEYAAKNSTRVQTVEKYKLPTIYNQNTQENTKGFKVGTQYLQFRDTFKVKAISPDGDLMVQKLSEQESEVERESRYDLKWAYRSDYQGANKVGFSVGDVVIDRDEKATVVGISPMDGIALKDSQGNISTTLAHDQEKYIGKTSNPKEHSTGIQLKDLAYYFIHHHPSRLVGLSDRGDMFFQPVDETGKLATGDIFHLLPHQYDDLMFPNYKPSDEDALKAGDTIQSADGVTASVLATNKRGTIAVKIENDGKSQIFSISSRRIKKFQTQTLAEFQQPYKLPPNDFVEVGKTYFRRLGGYLTAQKKLEDGSIIFTDQEGEEVTLKQKELSYLYGTDEGLESSGFKVGEEVYRFGSLFKIAGIGRSESIILQDKTGRIRHVDAGHTSTLAKLNYEGESKQGFKIGDHFHADGYSKSSYNKVLAIEPFDGTLTAVDTNTGRVSRKEYPNQYGKIRNPNYPKGSPFKINDDVFVGYLEKKGKVLSVSDRGTYFVQVPDYKGDPRVVAVDNYRSLLSDRYIGSYEGELLAGDIFADTTDMKATVVATNGWSAMLAFPNPQEPSETSFAYFNGGEIKKIKETSFAQFFREKNAMEKLISEGLEHDQAKKALEEILEKQRTHAKSD